MGGISNYLPIVDPGELEVALGLRMLNESDPFKKNDIENMALTHTAEKKVRLRGVTSRGEAHEWLLDPGLGYAAVWYGVYDREDAPPWAEYRMKDFRPVEGLLLPFRVEGVWRMDPDNTIQADTVMVDTYRLDDPENTPERYRIRWPDGASVVDNRARVVFRAEGGCCALSTMDGLPGLLQTRFPKSRSQSRRTSGFPAPSSARMPLLLLKMPPSGSANRRLPFLLVPRPGCGGVSCLWS